MHLLRAAAGLLLAWAAAMPAAAQELEPPPLGAAQEAAAEVEAARAELRRIVGPRLLRAPAPRLPRFPDLRLTDAEAELVRDLSRRAPAEWRPGERERLALLLDRTLPAIAAARRLVMKLHGEDVAATSVLPLVRATRLLALRDRLAWLEGDAARFADGLDERMGLAEALGLQPGILGGLLRGALLGAILKDVQLAVSSPRLAADTLTRLEGVLLRAQDLPDAAAVLAREALFILDGFEERRRATGLDPGDPEEALFTAPVARHMLALARACREGPCRQGAASVWESLDAAAQAGPDPYEAIGALLLPNFTNALDRMDFYAEVTELALAAVALRRLAIEMGGYPPTLDALPATLAAGRGELPGVDYQPRHAGGARLSLRPLDRLASWGEDRKDEMGRLLVWELPPWCPGAPVTPPKEAHSRRREP